jgi:S-DNA-T family DNA segregation ATPase FtsK/SpoIIIE
MEEIVFTNSFKKKKKEDDVPFDVDSDSTPKSAAEEKAAPKIKADKAESDKPKEKGKAKAKADKSFEADDTEAPNMLKDGRAVKITGLLLLLFSFVMGASILSFIFTVEEDQSLLYNNALQTLGDNTVQVNNALGRLGAVLANLFFNRLFGFSSLIVTGILFSIGFNLAVKKSLKNLVPLLAYGTTAIVWLSATLAFVNGLVYPSSIIAWGGGVGNYLTGTGGVLIGLVQVAGTAAVLLVSALIYAVVMYNISFDGWFSWMKRRKEEKELQNTFAGQAKAAMAQAEANDFRDTSENIFGKDNLDGVINSKKNQHLFKPDLQLEVEDAVAPIEAIQQNKVVHSLEEEAEVDLFAGSHDDVDLNDIPEIPFNSTPYDPTEDLSNYKFPPLDLLQEHGTGQINMDKEELERNKDQIIATLNNYQIEISKIKATVGPTVTLYEIVPAPGVRISKIKNLEDDIALSLAALGIRIIAPIPGKGTVGIEVPNINKEIVSMRSMLMSDKFQNSTADLPICLGKSISNEIYIADLAKMPHLLMAGATGQGKSVGINAILVSLLYKKHPSQIKFVMVDPKKVELSIYETLEKHFLAKLPGDEDSIITDTKKVVTTLNALCIEMDQRYDLLKKASVRNLKEYNAKFISRKLNPKNGHKFLPYIVLVIDEFADLIMTAGKEVEMPIARLAQLARAIGIHLILATQRPSVNIITGTIKANFPARIAFRTSSKIDSRTILDQGGAEQLIGRGDMLLSVGSDMLRLQCGFVDTPEVEMIRDFISEQQGYTVAFELPEYINPKGEKSAGDDDFLGDGERDDLFEDAARVIIQNQMGSTSLIQRRLKLGYNRAGRLMDQLEEAGIVGENLGSKAREVKFKTEAELEQFLQKIR